MQRSPVHPVFLAAGVAVLIFSGLGTAALMGWLPSAASKSEATAVAQNSRAAKAPQAKGAKPAPACPTCGVIESVQTVQVQGEASGVGAVAGGVAGAVVGNQFGHGTTNTVLTVAGAAGGAYAGNQIEKHVKKHTVFRVAVRMDDGTLRTLLQSAQPPFAIGERVRIVNGDSLQRA